MKLSFGPYSKAITAIIGQAITFASLYYGTNHWVSGIIAAAAALGVYAVPNTPKPSSAPPPAA
jgi:hypothetical protein